MSNEKGGYVLIDINPLVGPSNLVKDGDTITSKYVFELLQKIRTGAMPVCANLGHDGADGILLGTSNKVFNMGTFQMPIVQNSLAGDSILIFTGIIEPIDVETCLATIEIVPSDEVDENGNPLEEATATWNIYANAE